MTRRGLARAAALAATVAALVPACNGLYRGSRTTGTAQFTEEWPSSQRPYDEVYADWTRKGRLVYDYDRLLDVSATFKSTEWRSAYVARRGRAERLPRGEIDDLARRELAESREHFELELLVRTYRSEDNDLQKNQRSRWRIVLIDDEGNQYEATEIRRDRRARGDLLALFPDLDAQDEAYIAKFPRTARLMERNSFSLLIASLEGSVELSWRDR